MNPEIKLTTYVKVVDVSRDGFIGYDINAKSKAVIKVFDKKLLDAYAKGDIVELIVEYITEEELKEDYLSEKETMLYVVIYEFMPRGFFTKDLDKNKFRRIAFYDARGILVLPSLENREIFEVGDCIKITIRKI